MRKILVVAAAPIPVIRQGVRDLLASGAQLEISVVAPRNLYDRDSTFFSRKEFFELFIYEAPEYSAIGDENTIRRLSTKSFDEVVFICNDTILQKLRGIYAFLNYVICDKIYSYNAKEGKRDCRFSRLVDMPENSFYIASFPRSGNSWLQDASDLYFDVTRADMEQRFFTYFFDGKNNINRLSELTFHFCAHRPVDPGRPLNIKTHTARNSFYTLTPKRKVIYIYRDGRDVVTSYYFFKRYRSEKNGAEFIFDDFAAVVREAAYSWAVHVRGWMRESDTLLINYDELHGDFIGALEKIAQYTGITPVRDAGSVKEMLEERRRLDKSFRGFPGSFYRKGISGDYKNYFTPELEEEFDSITGGLLKELGFK